MGFTTYRSGFAFTNSMAASNESKSQDGRIVIPTAFISCWPKSRSSSSRSVYAVPPTTAFPRLRRASHVSPYSTSSNTITSAQSTLAFQSATFGTNPSPTRCSVFPSIHRRTSAPSFCTCHARSMMPPKVETKRNRVG